MKAIQVAALDGPASIELVEVPIPKPGPGEIRVEVAYAGVTFPELLQTRGLHQNRPTLPFVLGSESSGVVVEVGEGSKFSVGDRVVVVSGMGAFAEHVVVADDKALPLPDNIRLAHGAGIPANVLTADFSLRIRGDLQEGQVVVVHGAAGGLGSAGVQLALAMGAEVVAVVSTDEKATMVQELGATHVVKADRFKDAVLDLYPEGVDVVYDPVGGDRFTDSIRVLKPFGQIQVLGFTGGDIPTVKVNRLLLKNVSVIGVALGAATVTKPQLVQEQWQSLNTHLTEEKLTPHIYGTYTLGEAHKALSALEERAVIGKVLIEVKPEM